ncbi:hypothetical protein QUA04_25190 [Microcoleus sp. S13_C5]
MRVIIQRVKSSQVEIEGQIVGKIGREPGGVTTPLKPIVSKD